MTAACEHGERGPCLACAELALEPAEPRAGERRFTPGDCIVYALIGLVILIWLFGLDGSMPLMGGMPQ